MSRSAFVWVTLASIGFGSAAACSSLGYDDSPGADGGLSGGPTSPSGSGFDAHVSDPQPTPFDSGPPLPPGPQPQFGATVRAAKAPPSISGGTLLVAKDGVTAVASDPDRDLVHVADLSGEKAKVSIALSADDEPGRVVEDGAGRVHVALRRGGAIVSIDLATRTLLSRRAVCPAPRGIAYDAAGDRLHVACAGGELVTLPAASGAPTRTVVLERDLRDVIVKGDGLLVSTFRNAELLTVDASGKVVGRARPASAALDEHAFVPRVAWRTIAHFDSVLMLHQREQQDPVSPGPGGYSGSSCKGVGVVQSVLGPVSDAGAKASPAPALMLAVLPVDVARSKDGNRFAIVAAGNAKTAELPQVLSVTRDQLASTLPCAGNGEASGMGEPIAVAFDGSDKLVVQSREPAALFFDGKTIPLSDVSRADTGHAIFHSQAGAFVACASCHAEGGDDAHVWSFQGIGPRRTQTFRGGLLGTEPFHWDGDMKDLTHLTGAVFQGRMSGPPLTADQIDALGRFADAIPAIPVSAPSDAAAVARGKALFSDPEVACAGCHSGAALTNNATVDVGTGKAFQVPSLRGIAFRAPFLHTGCAPTLLDRFGACGGGDQHGKTSHLSAAQLRDLVAYLETL